MAAVSKAQSYKIHKAIILNEMDFDLLDTSLDPFLWVILAATSRFNITRENVSVCGYDCPA
jgi:hypothetical protein